MCFHVGGSCDVHVMVVPVFSHAMVVHACYIKSFRFIFFTCHGGSCSFSCHGGSCFLTGHAGSCFLHVIWGVHGLNISWRFIFFIGFLLSSENLGISKENLFMVTV